MAESRLASARPTSPRRPGAPAPRPVPRPAPRADALPLPLDALEDVTAVEGPRAVPVPSPRMEEPPPAPSRKAPARSRAEKILVLVLLLGFGLNLAAFLIEGGDLTRLDLLFAGVISLSGLGLLGVTEICRRTGRG